MKIAVTYENGQVFQHFGHTAQFKLYQVEDGQVLSSQVVETNGSGHGALAGFLQAQGVDTLLCGGIGGGAKTALAQAGIQLYGGVTGSADQAVADLLAGKLIFLPDVLCTHHGEGHGEGHSCGEHGCGGHSCGNHGDKKGRAKSPPFLFTSPSQRAAGGKPPPRRRCPAGAWPECRPRTAGSCQNRCGNFPRPPGG